MDTPEFKQLLAKARDAKRGGRDAWAMQSTGEKVAVALVLNEPAWLADMGFTLAEAIDRMSPAWLANIPRVEHELRCREVW